MKRTVFVSVCVSGAVLFAVYCGGGQVTGVQQDDKGSIKGVLRTILLAESIENIEQKENLLRQAFTVLQAREDDFNKQKKKGIGATRELDALFALYYIVKGDTQSARLYVDKYKGLSPVLPIGVVSESRLILRTRGSSGASSIIPELKELVRKNPRMSLAYLVLGDAYYLKLDIRNARAAYRSVLRHGGVLQVLAADRLETINKIERTKLDPKKFQNLIFAQTLRRGEIADILFRVYSINKKFRTRKSKPVSFTDIGQSAYAASINGLAKLGFFSYIKGNLFEPLKSITRREMALIVEDYLVFSRGNNTYRQKYKRDKVSSIKNLPVSDTAYNAVRLAVENNIMDVSLSGSINPDEAINGLEGLIIINKMLRK